MTTQPANPPVVAPAAATPPPTQSQTPFWQDKALYVMVLGVVLPFVSGLIGIQLDPVKVAGFVLPIVTYIIMHKAKSASILVAEIKARAVQSVAASSPTTAEGAAVALNAYLAQK